MSDFDDNEKSERNLWNIFFRATAAQCTEIERRKCAHPSYRRWAVVDYLVKYGRFSALDPAAVELCEELIDLDMRMTEAARKIVADVTEDRA